MERRLSAAIGIIGVVGAAIWMGLAVKLNPSSPQTDGILADFDMAVREASAGAQARAVTLSQLPRVGWAVATDEATVRDLTVEELAFRPQVGEHIEIAQVERAALQVRRLIRIPADGRPVLNVTRAGLFLVPDTQQLHVMAVVGIEARERGQVVSGLVAVAQALDLSALTGRLKALGIAARLETPDGGMALTDLQPLAGTHTVRRTLRSPAAASVKVVLSVPGGRETAWGHVAGAGLLLVVSVGSAVGLARRGARRAGTGAPEEALRRSSPRPAAPVPAAVPAPARARPPTPAAPAARATDVPTLSIAPDPKDISAMGAFDGEEPTTTVGREAAVAVAGVLPPPEGSAVLTDDGAPKLKPLEISGSINTRGSAMTIPSSLFVTGAGGAAATQTASSMRAADNPWTAEYRKLFSEFVKLRRTCGESTEDLNRDRFVEALQQKRIELVERQGANEVKFQLAFDNGKAAVRFKTVG